MVSCSIVNCMALHGTPLSGTGDSRRLLHSSIANQAGSRCVTLFPTKVSYCEGAVRVTIHRILVQQESSSQGEESAGVEKIVEEEIFNGKIGDNDSSEDWIEVLDNMRKKIDEKQSALPRDKFHEYKYFDIRGPFPLLKHHNFSIFDVCICHTCGFSTQCVLI